MPIIYLKRKSFNIKSLIFFMVIFSIVIFNSCTIDEKKTAIEESYDLQKSLSSIHNNVITNKFNTNTTSIKNSDFFQHIDEFKKLQSEKEQKELILRLEEKNEYKTKDEIKISKIHERIIKSYYLSLSYSQNNAISITQYYILEIDNLKIPQEIKQELKTSFIFIKDLMIYLDYDNPSNLNQNKQNWAPCAFRDCLDCCMHRKLQEIEEANFVDQAWFVLTAASSTTQMALSCSWDCW